MSLFRFLDGSGPTLTAYDLADSICYDGEECAAVRAGFEAWMDRTYTAHDVFMRESETTFEMMMERYIEHLAASDPDALREQFKVVVVGRRLSIHFKADGYVTLDVVDEGPDAVAKALTDWWYGCGDYASNDLVAVWDALNRGSDPEPLECREV